MRSALQAALGPLVLAGLAIPFSGCTGGGDPTDPSQVVADGTYVLATITALDTGAPCRPGIACAPEFFSCDATQGITVPKTWTMRATLAEGGSVAYTPYAPDMPPIVGQDARTTLRIDATDTASDTAVSIGFGVSVNRTNGSLTVTPGLGDANFANVDVSCTELTSGFDPFLLFQMDTAQPMTFQVTGFPVSGPEIAFAQRQGVGLTDAWVEGTFDFIAANRQVIGQVYIGNVRVQGCFRVHMPRLTSALPVDPSPASAPCS